MDKKQQLTWIIVLSARTEENLIEYTKNIVEYLNSNNVVDNKHMDSLAYTLQVGRDEMEERLAIVVSNIDELKSKLLQFIQGSKEILHFYTGKAEEGRGKIDDTFVNNVQLDDLAEMWTKGASFDWELLYSGKRPRRMPLPGYPFTKASHWIEESAAIKTSDGVGLHPLIDTNESTLEEQCYKKELWSNSFYLRDHIIDNNIVLPGVCHIEMVVAAGNLANKKSKVQSITNLTWMRPVVVMQDKPHTVYIGLYPNGKQGNVDFEVYTLGSEDKRIIYSQGVLQYNEHDSKSERFDIDGIKARCHLNIDSVDCYNQLKSNGLEYGTSFQGIKKLYTGSNEAISEIMPDINDLSQYKLHPSIMDSALHTIAPLLDFSPHVPYSFERLDIINPITKTPCYSYVTSKNGGQTHDVILLDEDGVILVKIEDFSLMPFKHSRTQTIGTIYYKRHWEQTAQEVGYSKGGLAGPILLFDSTEGVYEHLKNKSGQEVILVKPGTNFTDSGENKYFLINPDDPENYTKLIESLIATDVFPKNIVYLWPLIKTEMTEEDEAPDDSISRGFKAIFNLTRALIIEKQVKNAQLLYIYKEDSNILQSVYSALGGFAKTASQEAPKLFYKGVALSDLNNLQDIILSELKIPNSKNKSEEVIYTDGKRFTKKLKEMEPVQEITPFMLKENSVCMITGGAGGLGLIFAEYLCKLIKAKVVLTGRTDFLKLPEEKKEKIDDLNKNDLKVVYIKGDILTRQGAVELVAQAKKQFGHINGIFHTAGVIRDSLIVNKSQQDMDAVIAPKIYGTINVDFATKDEDLDFFVLFSSITSVLGNPGQSCYTYANSFMDNFAFWREDQRLNGRRNGYTRAINWPLWAQGGMTVDSDTLKWIESSMGIIPISPSRGIKALELLLHAKEPQVVVIEGIKEKLRGVVNNIYGEAYVDNQPLSEKAEDETSQQETADLKDKTEDFLKEMLSKELTFPASKIKSGEMLEKYGIDSVIIMSLTRKLQASFGELPKTIFFEYQTIDALSGYFIKNHSYKLLEITGIEQKETVQPEIETKEKPDISLKGERFFTQPRKGIKSITLETEEEIAIIGLSGRFPQANTLDEFWLNLKAGKDCITEIPKSRWDYRKYYGSDKEKKKVYNIWGGFIDRVDMFEPLFFSIAPKDAELMDPQERIFLETAWKTFEDGAYTKDMVWNKHIGVFVGVMYSEYQLFGAEEVLKGNIFGPNTAYASIANRVSYHLNLKGPSMAVDTMCSSSLTSVHLACESIKRGECEMAIAGGVNVSIHPHKYVVLSQLRFSSTDGRCRSFGEGGDGYVPGEGVGALLLKPLSKAVKDGDYIYAIIKGSYLNHGGKTNGYTVPNPVAQAEVISKALEKAGVNPRTISYVEAHGTGTPLGDPIEIAGLSQAYKETGQYCPIGSIKSNIGHSESAAGIAGLTKILLQMQHKQLVPSIHSKTINPNIDFKNSPFYVQRELAGWPKPVVEGKEYPRRAAINSFGAGGANAHIILEEYEMPVLKNQKQDRHIIVLSAMTDSQLRHYVKFLIGYLKNNLDIENTSILNIAYTSQTGRQAMEQRLAIIVSNVDELKDKLNAYDSGQTDIKDLYYGEQTEEQESVIDIDNKSLDEIAKLWTNGSKVDWELLYKGLNAQHIPLPTYPFEGVRVWIPTTPNDGLQKVSRLHPLIEKNISTLKEQRFVTNLTGEEFYLTDHVIYGEKTMPGVVYVEMARAAGEIGMEQKVVRIEGIHWIRPIIISNKPKAVQVSLYPGIDGVEFEITSTEEKNNTKLLHSEGKLIYQQQETINNDTVNIDDIVNRCPKQIDIDEFYNKFKNKGFDYGTGFKTIQKIYLNDTEVISRLQVPQSIKENQSGYVLHPSILDGALQSVMGLLYDDESFNNNRYLPFGIEEIEIRAAVSEICYVHVTAGEDNTKYNLKVLDESGEVLVGLREFSMKMVKGRGKKADETDVVYYQSLWEKAEIHIDNKDLTGNILLFDTTDTIYNDLSGRTNVILVKPDQVFNQSDKIYTVNKESAEGYVKLMNSLNEKDFLIENIIYLWPSQDQQFNIHSMFYLAKALTEWELKNTVKLLYFYIDDWSISRSNPVESALNGAMSGFLKTLSQENQKISCKTIAVPGVDDLPDIIMSELNTTGAIEIRYENNQRLSKQLKVVDDISTNDEHLRLRENGVYVITGGVGGLGLIFAEYIIKQPHVKVILTGRSEQPKLSEEKQEQITSLNEKGKDTGSEIIYMKADISTKSKAKDLVNEIKSKYGQITGLIHSAGVIKDSFIKNKTVEDLDRVIEPKINGTINLDYVLRDEEMDFFVLYSSLAGVTGSVGQCDYSYANSFLDYFAFWIEETRHEQNRKIGKTISINWPLWEQGGMDVDETTRNWMKETKGMAPLQTKNGTKALDDALRLAVPQMVVIEGDKGKINKTISKFNGQVEVRPAQVMATTQKQDTEKIKTRTDSYLKKLVAGHLKLNESQIKLNTPLEKYGIESVTVMNVTMDLEKQFGELPKTLLFEYQTVDAITGYFLENHSQTLNELFDSKEEKPKTVTPKVEPEKPKEALSTVTQEPEPPKTRPRFIASYEDSLYKQEEDVAIIGISGRYPQAHDLEEFWENLKAGKDCITEIPSNRWDYNQYYSPDKDAQGTMYTKWGGFIEDYDKFDNLFFNMSPRESKRTDPQERIFVETVWHTIEDSAYTKTQLWGKKIGVFVGVMYGEYQLYGAEEILKGNPFLPGSSYASIANRVSFFFNFTGPSIALDTMCSSSLTSIHLACESIKRKEIEMAVAGGVNLSMHPHKYLILSNEKFFSTDGRCRSFGEGGSGYVPGEGVGAVLLKPLSKAIKDRDYIYAVIKSTSLNHGGKANGYSVPNPNAQGELILEALNKAKIDPATINYVEAHGTGTPLGDPIEIRGMMKAFVNKNNGQKTQYCSIGSVKSNIGHTESAAGIAGLTKVLLQMRHKQLVPSLHSDKLNQNINFDNSPFYVQQDLQPWHDIDGRPRRAGISSFGAGGSNAHIIVEEYTQKSQGYAGQETEHIIVLSAKSKEQLKQYASKIISYIEKINSDDQNINTLPNIAYTLQTGREPMEERLALIVSDISELKEKFSSYVSGETTGSSIYVGSLKDSHVSQLLIDGDEGSIFIKLIIENKKLSKLAELWVSGLDIDWNLLYTGQTPNKIPLPTYPFAKIRHWFPQAAETVAHREVHYMDSSVDVIDGSAQVTLDSTPLELEKEILHDILNVVTTILMIDKDQIEAGKDLISYGFDSVRFTELTNAINKKYNTDITPDIFYEYHTISSFIKYLTDEYNSRLLEHYSIKQEVLKEPSKKPVPVKKPVYIHGGRKDIASQGVAIVGMSAVMPQSDDVNAFWNHIVAGDDLITEVPGDRWDWREYYGDPMKEVNKTKAKYGGFINDIDKFDSLFFGISPKEAEFMDPQQRLFLECVWRTIADAGYKPSDLAGTKTGIFVGVGIPNYAEIVHSQTPVIEAQMSTGNAFSILANRVSYLLDIHGPSEPIDTACSSSLVAIHKAVDLIESGTCDMAIAGGVNAILSPTLVVAFSKAGMLSEDGRCKTFDKDANGYVRGEGVGTIMLKPLDKAIQDRDNIYAVVKGTAVNHGGHTASLTAPNPNAQADLLMDAYTRANIDPSTVTYIEAHGTGTPLGDPIEIRGLKKAFSQLYKKWGKDFEKESKEHCGIGSVKTNIGHLETAAGIAGIIKVLLSMKNNTLAPHINFKELNPYIKLEDSPFYIVTRAKKWEQLKDEKGSPVPRRAGVSSFGFGGVYAHVVLEQYNKPEQPVQTDSSQMEPQLIVLSAKNEERLVEYAGNIVAFLKTTNESIDNIAYTLQTGREPMKVRIAMIASSIEEMREALTAYIEGKDSKIKVYQGDVKKDNNNNIVIEGQAGQAYFKAMIKNKEIDKIAQLWVEGTEIDWELLYSKEEIF